MSGEIGITINQLRKIADFFNRGILFFMEKGQVNDELVYSPQFRTIANQKAHLSPKVKAIIERAEHQRDIYINLREELGEIEKFKPPNIPQGNPKQAAILIRKWLGLDKEKDFNGYRNTVESKGILVFRSNVYPGNWLFPKEDPIIGFSLFHNVYPIILVRKQIAESRLTFTLMHELIHLLLHRKSWIDENDDLYNQINKHEREANALAGLILVPDSFLRRIKDSDRPQNVEEYDSWLVNWRKKWGVSSEVILRRLLDSGRLDQEDYQSYRDWFVSRKIPQAKSGSRKNRHREPKHILGSPYVCTVLDALSANNITLNKASTYLDNISIKDLHKLEEHYASL